MLELIYETHATTVDNETGHATGWLPGQLSPVGLEQAVELGARRRDVNAVFSSDLGRALETVAVGFGGNSWAGGENTLSYGHAVFLPGSTVTLDGKPIVEKGDLKL